MPIQIKSNSPLRSLPEDYCSDGADRWFEIPDGFDKGKKLFYSDYGPTNGTIDKTVLFVHGNPECSYTFRHARDALLGQNPNLRIICPDHIGMGISDQADFEMVDMHHAANLRLLIKHLDLRNVVLVVHDWGGPIGVGAFLDQMDRVDALVILNTTIFPMPSDGITYANWPLKLMPWSSFGWLIPDIFWGGVAAFVLQGANPGSVAMLYAKSLVFQCRFALRRFSEGTPAYVFSEALRGSANARSSKRNLLQTPYWGHGYQYKDKKHGVQDNHEFYRNMQEQLPKFWGPEGRSIPVAAHIGEYDPCGKESVREQWLEALPRMAEHLHVYSDMGHFIEEYKGPEIAQSIVEVSGVGG
ncbi:MAG: alpha/beta fold hydrolase [Oceanococcus sp.]